MKTVIEIPRIAILQSQYFLLIPSRCTRHLPDRWRRPRNRGRAGRRGHGGLWRRRRRSCPEVDRWIAASRATGADGSTATRTHSSARQTGGAPVADASRHDRDVLPLASCKRGPDVARSRRLFPHVPTYLPTHPGDGGRGSCVRVPRARATRPYAPPHAVYKYGRDSTRRISNNHAVKYRR